MKINYFSDNTLYASEWIIPVAGVIRIICVVPEEEILAGGDSNWPAVEDVGFSRAGCDAFDQGAAAAAEDHDIAGVQLPKLTQAEDEAALVDRRFHGCRGHVAQIEDEAEQDQHQDGTENRNQYGEQLFHGCPFHALTSCSAPCSSGCRRRCFLALAIQAVTRFGAACILLPISPQV